MARSTQPTPAHFLICRLGCGLFYNICYYPGICLAGVARNPTIGAGRIDACPKRSGRSLPPFRRPSPFFNANRQRGQSFARKLGFAQASVTHSLHMARSTQPTPAHFLICRLGCGLFYNICYYPGICLAGVARNPTIGAGRIDACPKRSGRSLPPFRRPSPLFNANRQRGQSFPRMLGFAQASVTHSLHMARSTQPTPAHFLICRLGCGLFYNICYYPGICLAGVARNPTIGAGRTGACPKRSGRSLPPFRRPSPFFNANRQRGQSFPRTLGFAQASVTHSLHMARSTQPTPAHFLVCRLGCGLFYNICYYPGICLAGVARNPTIGAGRIDACPKRSGRSLPPFRRPSPLFNANRQRGQSFPRTLGFAQASVTHSLHMARSTQPTPAHFLICRLGCGLFYNICYYPGICLAGVARNPTIGAGRMDACPKRSGRSLPPFRRPSPLFNANRQRGQSFARMLGFAQASVTHSLHMARSTQPTPAHFLICRLGCGLFYNICYYPGICLAGVARNPTIGAGRTDVCPKRSGRSLPPFRRPSPFFNANRQRGQSFPRMLGFAQASVTHSLHMARSTQPTPAHFLICRLGCGLFYNICYYPGICLAGVARNPTIGAGRTDVCPKRSGRSLPSVGQARSLTQTGNVANPSPGCWGLFPGMSRRRKCTGPRPHPNPSPRNGRGAKSRNSNPIPLLPRCLFFLLPSSFPSTLMNY